MVRMSSAGLSSHSDEKSGATGPRLTVGNECIRFSNVQISKSPYCPRTIVRVEMQKVLQPGNQVSGKRSDRPGRQGNIQEVVRALSSGNLTQLMIVLWSQRTCRPKPRWLPWTMKLFSGFVACANLIIYKLILPQILHFMKFTYLLLWSKEWKLINGTLKCLFWPSINGHNKA